MTCLYWNLIAKTRNVQTSTDSGDITTPHRDIAILIPVSKSTYVTHTQPRIFLDLAVIFRYLELKFSANDTELDSKTTIKVALNLCLKTGI